MADRKYRNLILGYGTYEGSKVPVIVVSCQGGDFDTPKDILNAFRKVLLDVAEGLVKEEEDAACSNCKRKTRTETARYCEFCGRPFRPPTTDFGEVAYGIFSEWFQMEAHEFNLWESLDYLGWQVGQITSGGFVRIDGFEQILLDDGFNDRFDECVSDAELGVIDFDEESRNR